MLETEVLEVMERLDEANRQTAEARAASNKGREEARRSQEEFDRQSPLIQGDIARLESELHQAEKLFRASFAPFILEWSDRKGARRLPRSMANSAAAATSTYPEHGQCGVARPARLLQILRQDALSSRRSGGQQAVGGR